MIEVNFDRSKHAERKRHRREAITAVVIALLRGAIGLALPVITLPVLLVLGRLALGRLAGPLMEQIFAVGSYFAKQLVPRTSAMVGLILLIGMPVGTALFGILAGALIDILRRAPMPSIFKYRFTTRDVLWLTTIVGCALALGLAFCRVYSW